MSDENKVRSKIFCAIAGLAKRLWVLLALLLGVQAGLLYISVSEVRVPDFIVKYFLKKLESEGVYCSIDDVRLRNLTVITAKGISVGATNSDSFLKIRRCAVKLGPDALISGNPMPRFVYVDGAQFICPPSNSPTGKEDVIFSDGTLILRRKDGNVYVDSAEFCVGNAKIVVYGKLPEAAIFSETSRISDSRESGKKTQSSVSEKPTVGITRFAGEISEIFRTQNLRSLLNSCELTAEMSFAGNSLVFDASALFREFNFNEKIHLKNISIEQKISVDFLNGDVVFDSPLCIFAENAGFESGNLFTEEILGSAKRVTLFSSLPKLNLYQKNFDNFQIPERFFLRADRFRLVNLKQGELNLEALIGEIASTENFDFSGNFDFKINVALEKTALACAGTLFSASETPALELSYDISADPNLIWKFPRLRAIALRDEVKALKFTENPQLRGNLTLGPDFNFENTNFNFFAGETFFENIHLCGLRFAGTLSPEEIRLPEVTAIGSDFAAYADIFFEFADDGKFRVRTWGSVDPEYIDGRLGWFWERIWRDLKKAPSEKRPRADIDVYGRWGERWEYVFGAIAGEKCYGNGVLIDEVSLRVYEDPLLIAAFDMRFKRGEDFAFGNLQWHYAMEPEYHYRDFRFLFDGSMPPKDVFQIVGEGLPEALSEIETEEAGTGVVCGYFSGDPAYYPDRLAVQIHGELPGSFSVFGIKGDSFRGEILYDNGVVLVDGPFFAEVDEGHVSGKIRVELPEDGAGSENTRVELDLELENIRRSRLFDTIAKLEGEISTEKNAPAEKELSEHKDTSVINASFAGSITLPDIRSLSAEGKFFVEDENLFNLQIFGGFSKLLSSLKIDLTTFPMDRAEGTYSVNNGMIHLPDTRIFGDSGEIDIQADLSLADFSIDGEAIFRNLRGTQIPLIGKFVEWGSSSTQLLPVKISGTLENPEWKIAPKLHRIWSWAIPKSIYDPESDDSEDEED